MGVEFSLTMQQATVPSGDSDEWYTPPHLVQRGLTFLGAESFELDVCATAESAKAPVFFTKEQDALQQQWRGDWWCNPPYSDIRPFVEKAISEASQYEYDSRGAMLLPNWTDRKWWLELIEPLRDCGLVRFGPRGDRRSIRIRTRHLPRSKFGFPGDPEGRGGTQPNWGLVLVAFDLGEADRAWSAA